MIFTPDLIDGLTLIGVIALMSVALCPLLMWVLTYGLEAPSRTFDKKTV